MKLERLVEIAVLHHVEDGGEGFLQNDARLLRHLDQSRMRVIGVCVAAVEARSANHLAAELLRLVLEGLDEQAADDKYLQPVGIHVHIGSQILEVEPFLEAARYLRKVVGELRAKGLEISTLDLGGGIGIDYEDDFRKPESELPIKTILPSCH